MNVDCRAIRNVKLHKAIQSCDRSWPFRVLSARRKSAFIVRLHEDRYRDHALVRDATNQYLLHLVEQNILNLSKQTLGRWVGDENWNPRICEICRLIIAPKVESLGHY